MNNHYLITGGCGFIGSHIAEELVKQGHRITIIDNLISGHLENINPFSNKVTLIRKDICDYEALLHAFEGVTHVFHEAAQVSVFESVERPEFCNEVNITGTLNILRAAKQNGVKRVVMASSAAVYGNNLELPKKETMLPEPASPYAVSKITDEYYLKVFAELYGVETVALRYFNVFGPRQDPSSVYSGVISIFSDCLLTGRDPVIFGDGLQTRDFVYVKDVVQANLLAMHTDSVGHGEVFNVGTGLSTSLLDLIAALEKAGNASMTLTFKPTRSGDIQHSVSDIAAIRDLGYAPQFKLVDGLTHLLHSLRNT